MPEPEPSTSGESALWVDPAEIPAAADIGKLGQALAAGPRGELDELMANVAAYAGLRQGELFALTAGQIATDARVITVDRKLIEVAGHLYVEAPKCRKFRSTIYPVRTPDGYPLAEKLAARIEAARAEQQAGTSPLGLIFPSPRFRHWRSSNFDRRVLAPAYRAAGWRDDARQRRLDLAQPAARVLHHRPVHLETRRHRRVPHGRPRQLPHHPRHVRRHHQGRPGPRPPRHPITTPGRDEEPGRVMQVLRPARFLLADHGGPACLTLISVSLTSLRCVLPPGTRNSRRQQAGLVSACGYPLAGAALAPLARDLARSLTEAGLPAHHCATHDPLYRLGGVCLLAGTRRGRNGRAGSRCRGPPTTCCCATSADTAPAPAPAPH